MAWQLRIEYEGAFYHVTSRGNQREKIFWDAKDRERLKTILERTKERYGYSLHAYEFKVLSGKRNADIGAVSFSFDPIFHIF